MPKQEPDSQGRGDLTLPAADPDALLIERVKAGDRAAFTRLAQRHQASLYRYARSLSRSDADAEDALQKALVSVWKSAATFAGRASVRAWLLTITRNAALRAGRLREAPMPDQSLAELGRRAGWGSDDPETLLSRLERVESLERALARLSDADREVIVLRDLEGLSGDETAAVLGVELKAMKSRLHRARLRLTAALTEESTHGT